MRAAINGFLFCILLIRYPAIINVHTRCSLLSLGGFLRYTGLLAFQGRMFYLGLGLGVLVAWAEVSKKHQVKGIYKSSLRNGMGIAVYHLDLPPFLLRKPYLANILQILKVK